MGFQRVILVVLGNSLGFVPFDTLFFSLSIPLSLHSSFLIILVPLPFIFLVFSIISSFSPCPPVCLFFVRLFVYLFFSSLFLFLSHIISLPSSHSLSLPLILLLSLQSSIFLNAVQAPVETRKKITLVTHYSSSL